MDADFARSLAGSQPWILMEHSTSAVNWQPRNIAKRGGELARNSFAHVARGADAVLFFQFRASRYGAEKFHSAMLPHAGTDTRVWREVVDLGSKLATLRELPGTRVSAKVAVIWSTESFWAMDLEWRPSVDLSHRERIEAFYTALWELGVTIDFVHPGSDLTGYRLVIAPSLYLLADTDAANVNGYVASGGSLLVSYFSGIVNANDEMPPGAAPGALRDVLGIEIHEFLPLHEGQQVRQSNGSTGTVWADDIKLVGAQALASYIDGPAQGAPALTRNGHGQGSAWYLSTKIDGDELKALVAHVLEQANVPVEVPAPGMEIVSRQSATTRFTFYINHSDTAVSIPVGFDALAARPSGANPSVPAGAARILSATLGEAAGALASCKQAGFALDENDLSTITT